ncbi:GntR family transcriptional regulator [Bacillus sp. ISL-75]|uniref:GntR family transcriptional regulator n=1 Tax=Bacillus sp. ISL-75 TaxID=2819137 RepID=UPI00203542F2|nr:GntR family transcriptional regulator [Bacillus sp. ISL-75]
MQLSPFGNRRVSTKDFVYFEIKKRIIESVLKPDQPINEENLAAELEISRTPIREALQRLEIEELIKRQPNGRLKVAPLTTQEANEIFTIRSLLEGLVTREATLKATPAEIQTLGHITQHIVEAAIKDNREDVVKFGSEYHSYLYEISGNKTALKMLYQLNDHISRYRRIAPTESNSRSKKAAQEHNELFEAIAKKDHEKAEILMREHIKNSQAAAIKAIESHIQDN